MKYREMKVKNATSQELLFELIKRNGIYQGPTIAEYPNGVYTSTVSIDQNHIGAIYLTRDDMDTLNEVMACADASI